MIAHDGTHTGNRYYIVDFYCAKLALCIEIDGAIHAGQLQYDEARTIALEHMGFRVIRFRNDELRMMRPEAVYARLDELLAEQEGC